MVDDGGVSGPTRDPSVASSRQPSTFRGTLRGDLTASLFFRISLSFPFPFQFSFSCSFFLAVPSSQLE
jgi:hypothetical protein